MVTESIVVLLLVLIIAYLYMRRGKRAMALAVLPLAVLPVMSLMGALIQANLPINLLLSPMHWRLLFVMVGMIAGSALLGVISTNIKKRSSRRLYLILCCGFTIGFAFAEMLAITKIL